MKQLVVLISLCVLTCSYGQEDTIKMLNLEGIQVTGIRADNKTPITETTILGKDVKKTYQGEEVPMVVGKTTSVTTSSDGGHPQGYTTFRLRGIDQTRINMTLNGVPLNEPEDQGVYFSNYSGFTNNIKSMQIQRGVGTSTNGVSSYAGSINFEGHDGLNKYNEFELGYGSFNTMRLNISNSTGLNDKKFALFTNFSSFSTDGYKYNSGSNGYSFFISGGYYGVKNVVKFTGFTGRSFNQMAWSAVSENDIKLDPRINYNTPVEDDDFMQSFVQLQYTRKLNSKSLLNTTIYYNRLDGQWNLDLKPLGAGTDILNYQLASNFYGLMSNYKFITNKFTFNTGIHGNLYNRQHSMGILPNSEILMYKNTGFKNELSAFMKLTYDINKLTLFGDMQLRYVTFAYSGDVTMPNLNWMFLNPKGGIVYNCNKNVRTYFSIGQSYREPTRNDMFMGEDNLITYTLVQPEQVIDYELGIGYKNNRIDIKSNLYYMDFKNEITLIGALGSNGLPLMMNVGKSFRSGFELLMDYKAIVRDKFSLTVNNNINLSHNRIIDNGNTFQPLYTPSIINNTNVVVRYKQFFIDINGKYNSFAYIDFDNKHITPSYFIMNMDLGYINQKYSLLIRINNMTNKSYYTNGYVIDNTKYFFVNAPTSVYVTLKMTL